MPVIRENAKARFIWDTGTGKLCHIHLKKGSEASRESVDTYKDKESAEKALDTDVRWGKWGKAV
jgi:hypothetical protein